MGGDSLMLRAASPFDSRDVLSGCPTCKAVNSTVTLCDVPGCKSEASCGTPDPLGYKVTCCKHKPSEVPA